MMQQIELFYRGARRGKLTYGEAPRSKKAAEALAENFDYIYNLKSSEKANWYFSLYEKQDLQMKRFIHRKDGFDDKKGAYRMAQQISIRVRNGARVYIHGFSLDDDSSAVALGALYLLCDKPDFDPVAHVRSQGHFEIAAQRHTRNLINHIKEKGRESINRWVRIKK